MSAESTDWPELREFRAINLTQSFILTWQWQNDVLTVDVDMSLAPEHALYEKPRPAEGGCFRAASIEFTDCSKIETGQSDSTNSPADVIASLAHGRISQFQRIGEGIYDIRGTFGAAVIHSDRPVVRLKNLSR